MIKFCPKCEIEKDIEDFAKNISRKDGHASWCKKCCQENDKKRWRRYKDLIYKSNNKRRKEIRESVESIKKSLKCQKCEDSRWYVLSFHHRDPKEKDFDISFMMQRGFSLEKIKEEINKCDVLCANCHTEFHFLERNKLK